MDKTETTAWLAEHGLNYARGTIERVPDWATDRRNSEEFCDYSDDGLVRIKSHQDDSSRIWNPLENLTDAWLLVEKMIAEGNAPHLIFDDNLIEDEGAWCCTGDGWNDIPNSDDEDVKSMVFSAICDYWYPTPELAVCAYAARVMEKILVQEEENRYELYDEPPVKITPWVQEFMDKITGETEDGASEEGTPGIDG